MTANQGSSPLAVAQQLAAIAEADTVYANLYRRRARVYLADVLSPAEPLGLEAVTLSEVPHGAEVIRRHALTAAFAGREVTREGATRVQAVITRFAVVRRERMLARWL